MIPAGDGGEPGADDQDPAAGASGGCFPWSKKAEKMLKDYVVVNLDDAGKHTLVSGFGLMQMTSLATFVMRYNQY